MGWCCVAWFSCNDDEEATQTAESQPLQSDEYVFQTVCAGLFNAYDSVYATPAIGVVLSEAQPTVYTIGVANEDESKAFFEQLCTDAPRCHTLSDGSIRYDLGAYGSLCYHPYGSGEELATLDVELQEVSSLSQLRFISKDLWPDNATSAFVVGDIVKDKYFGYNWVCVQECADGKPALFLSFVSPKVHTSGQDKTIRYSLSAGYDALEAWYQLLQRNLPRFTTGTTEYQQLQKIDSYIANAADIQGRSIAQIYYTGLRNERIAESTAYGDIVSEKNHIIVLTDVDDCPVGKDVVFICSHETFIYETWQGDDLADQYIDEVYEQYFGEMYEDFKNLSDVDIYELLGDDEEDFEIDIDVAYASAFNVYLQEAAKSGGVGVQWTTVRWQYHSGTIEYGGKKGTLEKRPINKNTLSLSFQNEAAMQMMFQKVL
jgi:hypothetical protein